jgi:spore germination protein YaaH
MRRALVVALALVAAALLAPPVSDAAARRSVAVAAPLVSAAPAQRSAAVTAPSISATPAQRIVAHACGTLRPSKLLFARTTGKTVGVLRWRGSAAARTLRYRVLRDGRTVGQTGRHSMRVRVSLDRRYRFAVVPLRPDGRRTRCGAAKRVRIAYRRPGAPRYLTVSGDERGLRLTWRPGRRGDSRLAGYRVLRDGKVVGQRATTRWTLPASPNRSVRFKVVAVDRRGRLSRPSGSVTAVTEHEPPTAPADLTATPTSESSILVAWAPSSVKAGRVVAYRLLRDGVVVGQVDGTSRMLDNLAPSTDYGISVVAIDDHGYASAPATIQARTPDPVPTGGHAHAYLLASTDQSFADFRAHYRQIGVVYPTYFDCTGSARLEGSDHPHVTRWAQARRVKVLPRINCQRTAVVERIVTDPTTRTQWLDALVQLARDHGYDGISLDFEAGPADARDALTSFVAELARRLHGDGRLLTVAVSAKVRDVPDHPRSGIFDYPALAEAADYLFLMAWGLHWSTSVPGPQDDLGWVERVVDYVETLPQRHKFVYGANLYALDWPAGGGPGKPATAYEYQAFVPFLPELDATVRLDPVSDNYKATYTDAAGISREVWYPDALSTGRRLTIAKEAGLGGVGFWRLGREDQRLWDHPLLAPDVAW